MKFIISILLVVSQIGVEGVRRQVSGIRNYVPTENLSGLATLCGTLSSNDLHKQNNSKLLPAVAIANEGKTFTTRNFSEEWNNSKLSSAHDYHISNFEIEYNAETKALEIIAKIFIDDLEDGIAASGVVEKLYLCTDREIETGDDHVYAYLSDKMNISIDGQAMSFNYIGKEVSEDLVAMYCYLEIEDVQYINEVSVSNDMLMELFDDQINIIKLKSKSTGKRGFMMLKKGQHSDTVQLQ